MASGAGKFIFEGSCDGSSRGQARRFPPVPVKITEMCSHCRGNRNENWAEARYGLVAAAVSG